MCGNKQFVTMIVAAVKLGSFVDFCQILKVAQTKKLQTVAQQTWECQLIAFTPQTALINEIVVVDS